MKLLRTLSLAFAAGCLGGLVNSVALWLFVMFRIPQSVGTALAAPWSPGWLYPRIVWGGLWALLFALPVSSLSRVAQGMLYSIGPTLVQLLLIFPYKMDKGMFGFDLGAMTPAFVVFFNLIWGVTAGFWLGLTERR